MTRNRKVTFILSEEEYSDLEFTLEYLRARAFASTITDALRYSVRKAALECKWADYWENDFSGVKQENENHPPT